MSGQTAGIIPVILCGGSGTRLWPASRKTCPKQFAPFFGETTLFKSSILRMTGTEFAAPLIVTNSDFRFLVREQLSEIGIENATVLIEPEARNSAPAILAAALYLERTDPGALMLVAPSDHVIPDIALFQASVDAARAAAHAGQIVTFGVEPTRPETGYGYLEVNAPIREGCLEPVALRQFIEKPSIDQANVMLASDNFLWNAGIFLFSVQSILAAFRKFEPDMMGQVSQSVAQAEADLGFTRLSPEGWSQTKCISVDYAVMERANNLSVVPFLGKWSDLGDWDAVRRETGPDEHGVSTRGPVTVIDCQESLLRSESANLELVAIGLKDIIAVAMPDAVLIADSSRAQDVKLAVGKLKEKQSPQAGKFPRRHRPWGTFETIAAGEHFQVKRILVKPGQSLSLQSHNHRAEHWVVVSGTATVIVDQQVQTISESQSVHIPIGAIHRLENPGTSPVVLIEIQTGSYLGEDDIIRYEDKYARN